MFPISRTRPSWSCVFVRRGTAPCNADVVSSRPEKEQIGEALDYTVWF